LAKLYEVESKMQLEKILKKKILDISTGVYCDRNDIAYEINIAVDIDIPYKVVLNKEIDKCIRVVIGWLLEKSSG
jgi:hypothetical protein